MVEGEQIYTIPLKSTRRVPRWQRSNRAIKEIREYLAKHMKADQEKIHLDASINEKIWERGNKKVPSKIRIKAMKFEDGVVEAEVA
ncbi:MAG: 50S ribosomal protein L31e [Methanocellales archaeon]|nr:50S ribosomal protein L31e [Methanocellales archaeon]MDI6859932.1 50S ribosomal protein L31e [Methanocellales archaeon]